MANKSDPNYIEKIRIIDDLIDHYPELKKDKQVLLNLFFDRSDRPNKFILERVIINGKTYYKSTDNLLIDVNIKCHGIFVNGRSLIIRSENRKEHYDKFIEEFKNYANKKFC
jgi:ribosomal protein L31